MAKTSLLRSWSVVLTTALFFFYIFIQMNMFNALSSDLTKEFHFNAEEFGQLFAAFNWGNVLFLFPAGFLLDRFSVRKLLAIVFLISIIATYMFSVSTSFWTMYSARFVVGLTGAFCFLPAIKLATRWFEPRQMASAIGMVVTIGMLGGAFAQTPLALLIEHFGWRHALQLLSLLGGLIMLAQIIIVRDHPEQTNNIDNVNQPPSQTTTFSFWHTLKLVITSKQNWATGFYISLVNLPIIIIGGIWGGPYLTQVHHLTQVEATVVTSMIFIGVVIGSPLIGFISDRLQLRKLPMIIGALLTILVMSAIVFAPTLPVWMEICLYLSLGIIGSSQVIGYPVITESNAPAIAATATSLASILIVSGGMLVPLFGKLLELSGDAKIIENIAIYSQADYIRANCLMLGGLVIALVASFLIKETFCQQLPQK